MHGIVQTVNASTLDSGEIPANNAGMDQSQAVKKPIVAVQLERPVSGLQVIIRDNIDQLDANKTSNGDWYDDGRDQ